MANIWQYLLNFSWNFFNDRIDADIMFKTRPAAEINMVPKLY